MNRRILEQLEAIEQEYQVNVLLAVEAGSRAWGFSSPDSDYDVRFIYRQPMNHYLSLFKKQDVIERGVMGDLDVGGWDIDKALRLLGKSNIPLMEWIYSPLVYGADPVFLEKVQELAQGQFIPAAGFHHYQSMAKKYVALCRAEAYKLKHVFYALRTALAAQWVATHQTCPPVRFSDLREGLLVPASIDQEITELRQLKADKPESYLHPASKSLVRFLEETMENSERRPPGLVAPPKDLRSLDEFFREVVQTA